MRKGLNFLGRKNQSLFDTNTKMKDMDNVELVLESSAIPESGTASVRARPTVKHHAVSISVKLHACIVHIHNFQFPEWKYHMICIWADSPPSVVYQQLNDYWILYSVSAELEIFKWADWMFIVWLDWNLGQLFNKHRPGRYQVIVNQSFTILSE